MERREFIRNCLPLFLVPSWAAQSCRKLTPWPSNGKSVVVVGAGISGLAAANQLKFRGFDVLVLESKRK